MEMNASNVSLGSLGIQDLMAWPYFLLIKMYRHRRHLFCHVNPLDSKMENNKGKAMVREIGVVIFSVIISDLEKALSRCQAPPSLRHGDPGCRYFPCEDEERWQGRNRGPLTSHD